MVIPSINMNMIIHFIFMYIHIAKIGSLMSRDWHNLNFSISLNKYIHTQHIKYYVLTIVSSRVLDHHYRARLTKVTRVWPFWWGYHFRAFFSYHYYHHYKTYSTWFNFWIIHELIISSLSRDIFNRSSQYAFVSISETCLTLSFTEYIHGLSLYDCISDTYFSDTISILGIYWMPLYSFIWNQ